MAGRAVRWVVAPTVAWAVSTSVLAVVVNLATAWEVNLWAWLAVVVTTALVAAASLWLDHRRGEPEPVRPVGGQVVSNSVIGSNVQVGGDITINRDRQG
ncbi:MAG TPA: hypothetical protein VN748_18565 [Pseudonocardiaceae bacterium]|nr:hypothetical protein [Pseudonocardiaceae bacterium]